MSTPLRTSLSRTGPRVVWRWCAGRAIPVLAALIALTTAMHADGEDEGRSLRERSSLIGRQVVATVGHRLTAPVRLEVVNDSADAVTGGFSEALAENGLSVRLTELPQGSGTVITVRRSAVSPDGVEGLDVRVEQWPERSVLYARLWMAGTEPIDGAAEGFFDRVLVPATVGAAAALIIYLFFTVRS